MYIPCSPLIVIKHTDAGTSCTEPMAPSARLIEIQLSRSTVVLCLSPCLPPPTPLPWCRQRIGAVLGYLRPKQPWVTSEPLLPWLAGVWLETLEDPLCVLLYR